MKCSSVLVVFSATSKKLAPRATNRFSSIIEKKKLRISKGFSHWTFTKLIILTEVVNFIKYTLNN